RVAVLHELPGEQPAHQQVRDELQGRVGRVDLAPAYRLGELHLEAVDLRLDQQLPQRPLELGVGVRGVPHAAQQCRVLLDVAADVPCQFLQVTAEGAGVHVSDVDRSAVPQGAGDQLRLALPLAVEGGLAGAGAGGDRVHGEVFVADLTEQPQDGL